ncbi:MAG: transposase [bacterium]|nr:transposase [bacterium]
MIVKVAERFPKRRFYVVADHLYNGRNVLLSVHTKVSNVSVVVRGRKDAALFELPPKRLPGTMGRPRTKGARLPNPETWASDNAKKFQPITVELYGRTVRVLVASFCGMPYRSLPGRLVRYVIVKDPEGIYRTEYFFTTDASQPVGDALQLYSFRWPIERTFQDCKQKLGLQDPNVQLPGSVRRCAPFGMLVYSLVVLWYLTDGHKLAASLRHHRDPWYPKRERPSFAEMLATIRRLSWAESLGSGESKEATTHTELAAYLIRVAAAA